MAEQFYTILTNIGKAKVANSTALGTKLNCTTMKIGDSNGSYYNPTETQVDIVHKVWEGNINSIKIDEDNPNWIIIEVIIPGDVGGFTIREVGIFDDAGDMIAIGKYPETYKPVASDGSTKDITVRSILEVSNSSSVTLKLDPTVIIATLKDIENLSNQINAVKENSTKIIVTEEDIPVEQREKGSFYFVVTDETPAAAEGEVKVSPTMGIKVL